MTDPGSFLEINFDPDYSREDLLKLLLHFEIELEQKEQELATLKDDKACSVLTQAKYGKLMMVDPVKALGRDGLTMKEKLNQQVLSVYEYQQRELEKLCQLHKVNHSNYKELMANSERRHRKILDELHNEKMRNEAANSYSENVIVDLEKSRNSFATQLGAKQAEMIKLEDALKVEKERREREKQDHKLMIRYLLSERKDLFIALQRMHLELNHKNHPSNVTGDSALVQEMKKEIDALRAEKNRLNGANQELNKKNNELIHKLKVKEEDVMSLRQNMNRIKQESQGRSNAGGLVMANKGATIRNNTIPMPPKNRIPNSSSFPTTAPGTSMGTLNQQRQIQPSTNIYKKFPTMLGNGGVQRGRGVPYLGTKASNLPMSRGVRTPTEPEIDHLGLVIESMDPQPMTSNSISKRSSSLPRNAPPSKEEMIQQMKPPSGIPTTRQSNTTPRSMPNPMSMGKHLRSPAPK